MPVSAATWVWNSNSDLQRALGDLRLIGRVAGEEFRALDQVVDGRGDVVAIGAGAEEERDRSRRDVARRHARQRALDLDLAHAVGQVERPVEPLVGGNVGKQRVDVGDADRASSIRARSAASSGR